MPAEPKTPTPGPMMLVTYADGRRLLFPVPGFARGKTEGELAAAMARAVAAGAGYPGAVGFGVVEADQTLVGQPYEPGGEQPQ